MDKKRSNDENKQIYDLCQDIRSFCFANASREIITNKDHSKGAFHVIERTSIDESPIGILIKKQDWETLFNNEEWLVMLEGAQNLNILYKYEPVKNALKKILELFPKETEGRIIPIFLR